MTFAAANIAAGKCFPVRLAAAALLLWMAGPLQAGAQNVPEPTGRWVSDFGSFLDQAEERLLGAKLAGYADTTSTQIVVVTVQSLDGYAPVDYAVRLGREWGVGQGEKDNGIVLLVAREERDVFIATGFGIEGSVTDAVAARIVRNIIVPAFREGRFYDGLNRAVDALMLGAAGEFDVDRLARGESSGGKSVDALAFIFLIIVIFILSAIRNRGGGPGRRRRSRSGMPIIFWGGSLGSGGGFGGGGFGGGGFGGFSGGGGSFGGGGAGGGW